MSIAIKRHEALLQAGKHRVIRFLNFTQDGEPVGEWDHELKETS